MQREDGQTVIARIANEQVSSTDANAMGIVEVPWPWALAAKTRDDFEPTLAGIEFFQLQRRASSR